MPPLHLAALNFLLPIFLLLALNLHGQATEAARLIPLDEFPNEVNSNFTGVRNVTLKVSLKNQRISLFINSTKYCLTDRAFIAPASDTPVDVMIPATLEPCNPNEAEYQTWETTGSVSIKAAIPRKNDTEPHGLPGYGVNSAKYVAKWIRNSSSKRCIAPAWGYPGSMKDVEGNPLPDVPDALGYVYVSSCSADEDLEALNAPMYNVNTGLLNTAIGPSRSTSPNYTEFLWFNHTDPTRPGVTDLCPNRDIDTNDTTSTPYRTKSFIIPQLITAYRFSTEVYPALFGCADQLPAEGANTLPIWDSSPIEMGLNLYVNRTKKCEEDNIVRLDRWPKTKKFLDLKDSYDTWVRCNATSPLRHGKQSEEEIAICVQYFNVTSETYYAPPPNPDPMKPLFLENCDQVFSPKYVVYGLDT
ncbi:hypothetical protein TWF281_000455 [Arthrobotrys megalospora]